MTPPNPSRPSAKGSIVVLISATTSWPLSARLAVRLIAHGCAVHALCPPGDALRTVSGIGRVQGYSGFDPLAALERAIAAADPDIIVPCDDRAVWQLHELHARRPDLRKVIEASTGDPASFATVRSRAGLLAAAQECGIRVPETRAVRCEDDLRAWFADRPRAAVLKLDGTWGGKGVNVVRSVDDAVRVWRRFTVKQPAAKALKRWLVDQDPLALQRRRSRERGMASVQRFISGRPANAMLASWRGALLGLVTVEVLCTQGPTGASTIVRLIRNEEIERAADLIVRRLGLSGFHGLDFILEEGSQAPYLIELNPRCTQLGHLVLPQQGDLAGLLTRALGARATCRSAAAIERELIAFFPQALVWNPDSPHMRQCHHDVPWSEPALARELLREPWPERHLIGRLYHGIRGTKRRPTLNPAAILQLAAASESAARPKREASIMYDSEVPVVIIGAGPYGLSIAACLNALGVPLRIFGEPMQSWRECMPQGMLLKSEGFASSLHDLERSFTLKAYCEEAGLPYQDVGDPVPLRRFVDYGLDFQRRLVPQLERHKITRLDKTGQTFTLTTSTGEKLTARRVIIASGISHFGYIPPDLVDAPPELVSHSSRHADLSGFRDQAVAVVGAGSSAVDIAALLHEAGADVHLIGRRSAIDFHEPSVEPRPLSQRIKAPRSGLGVGWRSRLCTDAPLLFHAMPEWFRLRVVKQHLGPAPGWFMKQRVVGRFPMHLATTLRHKEVKNGSMRLILDRRDSGRMSLEVAHVVAATGYRPVIRNLPFLSEDLLAKIARADEAPVLNRKFECSVPGLHWVGLASANSFGPLTRFAYGAEFTARRLAKVLAAGLRVAAEPATEF
jgi:thioredoxin reductase